MVRCSWSMTRIPKTLCGKNFPPGGATSDRKWSSHRCQHSTEPGLATVVGSPRTIQGVSGFGRYSHVFQGGYARRSTWTGICVGDCGDGLLPVQPARLCSGLRGSARKATASGATFGTAAGIGKNTGNPARHDRQRWTSFCLRRSQAGKRAGGRCARQ